MKRFEWLDRGLIYGPYYTLCLNDRDFVAALAHLGIKDQTAFLSRASANATTHFCTDKRGKLCAVVCLGAWQERTGVEIAGLLIHEAVHIFRNWRDSIGEKEPGEEFEAYSIQWLSQQLMWEFDRQTKRGRR